MKSLTVGFCLCVPLLVSLSRAPAQITLPAGTAVSVKMIDGIDSYHDPANQQYRASIAGPINIRRGLTIASGSPATVILTHNNSGWVAQLSWLTINGKKLPVTSSAATITALPQAPDVKSASKSTDVKSSSKSTDVTFASRVRSIVRSIIRSILATLINRGRHAQAPPPPAGVAIASGPLVILPAATEVRFVLLETASAAHHPIAVAARLAPVTPAVSSPPPPQQPESSYLCRGNYTATQSTPMVYYVTDIFQTNDNPVDIEQGWIDYLLATYPNRFDKRTDVAAHCTQLQVDTAQQNAKASVEREWKSENAEVVETHWRYILGPTGLTPATGSDSYARPKAR
jgi:hypothetical protein